MKFKVGDRVKYLDSIVKVIDVGEGDTLPYVVEFLEDGWECHCTEDDLELVQPEAQEPVPGKFYRTRGGDKVLFTGIHSHYWIYVLLTSDPSIVRYSRAFEYNLKGKDLWDIIGEWVDEVVLPAMEIKRWAVVSDSGTKRGAIWSSWGTKEQAITDKDRLWHSNEYTEDFEIVELTGTLPERKVT